MTTETKKLQDELTRAIDRSTSHDEIVHVEVDSIEDAITTLHTMWGGDLDYVDGVEVGRGDRYTDVWGWDDETPENEQEWRLHLYASKGWVGTFPGA